MLLTALRLAARGTGSSAAPQHPLVTFRQAPPRAAPARARAGVLGGYKSARPKPRPLFGVRLSAAAGERERGAGGGGACRAPSPRPAGHRGRGAPGGGCGEAAGTHGAGLCLYLQQEAGRERHPPRGPWPRKGERGWGWVGGGRDGGRVGRAGPERPVPRCSASAGCWGCCTRGPRRAAATAFLRWV